MGGNTKWAGPAPKHGGGALGGEEQVERTPRRNKGPRPYIVAPQHRVPAPGRGVFTKSAKISRDSGYPGEMKIN